MILRQGAYNRKQRGIAGGTKERDGCGDRWAAFMRRWSVQLNLEHGQHRPSGYWLRLWRLLTTIRMVQPLTVLSCMGRHS